MTAIILLKDRAICNGSESHNAILEVLGITSNSDKPDYVKVSMWPPYYNMFSSSEFWRYSVEQDYLPDWYNEIECEKRCRDALDSWMNTHVFYTGKHTGTNGLYYALGDTNFVASYDCKVIAGGNAHVTATINSTVTAYDTCTVEATHHAIVYAHDYTKVKAHDWARIEAHNNAVVECDCNSQVIVSDNTTVNAYGSSIVTSYDKATVTARDCTHVLAHDSSKVDIYDISTARIGKTGLLTVHDDAIGILEDGDNVTCVSAQK